MKFSPVIQYLRALAAMMVLCYHVVLHWIPTEWPRFIALSGGVDIFFVISGYVMWSLTAGREGGAWQFLKRRLQRIVPLYWLMTTAMLVVLIVMPGAALNSKIDVGHVILSYLFIPALHPVKGTFEPLLFPGWTLNYEMMFYGLITLALLAPMRFRLALILTPLAGLMVLGLFPHSDKSVISFYSNSRIAEFAWGCLLGVAVEKGLADRATPAIGLLMVVVGALAFLPLTVFNGPWRGIAWGLPAAMFVAGWVFNERAVGTPRIPALQLLGDASYAIYLSHVIVLSALFQVAHHFAHSWPTKIAASVVISLICLIVGVGVYSFIEKPIIAWFKEPRLKVTSAAAAAE